MNTDTPMPDNDSLLPHADWQTPLRGTNENEYAIYVENARALGWVVKSYDEWMAS